MIRHFHRLLDSYDIAIYLIADNLNRNLILRLSNLHRKGEALCRVDIREVRKQ